MHLILVANIKDKKWRNILVKQGELITSVKGLSDKLGFSVQQIRTGLTKLKSTGDIAIKTTNKFTIITLINWHTYNTIECNNNKQITNEQQTNNKQITTTKEVKKEKNKPLPPNGVDFDKSKTPDCPHSDIINLYHEILPELPHIKIWNDKRKINLRARWREDKKRQKLEYWQHYFEYVRTCDLLMGKVGTWKASLDWLIMSSNFAKVIEGNYASKLQASC